MIGTMSFERLVDLGLDAANGWSIGSFGAIGEFVRDPDEPVDVERGRDRLQLVTPRGALRIAPRAELLPVAWDSLSADGESWGHALAFCCARPETGNRVIRPLGPDTDAARQEDRRGLLFDLGVGSGAVTLALRTGDAGLIAALATAEGTPLLSRPALMGEVLRAQPHRVLLSPAGRLEVFQPIPPAGGKSPIGPHTHLLTKLVSQDRSHSSNTPIPDGMQAALTLHPRSPWRTMLGERHPFEADIDAGFAPMLRDFGLADDIRIDADLRRAIETDPMPRFAAWPQTRRGRTKARIVLRRMAAAGDERVKPWRALFDRAPIEGEEGEEVEWSPA